MTSKKKSTTIQKANYKFALTPGLELTITFIAINTALALVAIGKGADLTALGTFIALSNVPLYGYLLGESFRPSGSINNHNKKA